MKHMIACIASIGLLLSSNLVSGQAREQWEPITLSADHEIFYSEGWHLDGCNVFVLNDDNGLVINTTSIGGKGRYYSPRPDVTLPETDVQHIIIKNHEGAVNIHMTWEFSSPIIDFAPNQTGPDLFYLLYRQDAQQLPKNVRQQFHELYGIK